MLNDLCHFLPNNCHPGAHGEEPERAEERATVSNRNIALDRYIGVVYKRTPSNKPMTTPRRQGHRACRIAGSPGSTSAFPVGELPPRDHCHVGRLHDELSFHNDGMLLPSEGPFSFRRGDGLPRNAAMRRCYRQKFISRPPIITCLRFSPDFRACCRS